VNEPVASSGASDTAPTAARVQSLTLSEESKQYRGGTGTARGCLLGVFLILSLTANALLAWNLFKSQPVEQTNTTTPTQPASESGLELTGTAAARSQVCVSPLVGGVVVELKAREGTMVKKGDPLARLDDTTARNELAQGQQLLAAAESRLKLLQTGPSQAEKDQAAAAVRESDAAVELAKLNLEKVRKFFEKELANESDVKAAMIQVQQAESRASQARDAVKRLEAGPDPEQLKAAKADVERAKLAVQHAEYLRKATEIHATADGVLVRVNVSEGETVQPGAGIMGRRDPDGCLFLIADVSQMVVEVDVPEAELTRAGVGRKCNVIPDRGGTGGTAASFEGVVESLAATVNPQRGTVRARVRVSDPNAKLLPGTSCRVIFPPAGRAG